MCLLGCIFFELSQNNKHKSTNYAVFQESFANVVFQNLIVSPRCSLFLFFFQQFIKMQRGWTRWVGRTGTTYLFFLFFSEKKKDTKYLAVNQQFQTPPKGIFLYVKFGNNCLLQCSFFIFLSCFLIFFTTNSS